VNVLVTGEKGYIGLNIGNYLSTFKGKYSVSYLSLRNDDWKNDDLSKYQVIIHAAAIVHKNEEERNEHLYFKVNRDLTVELATQAKKSGVKQFIFMSTISVYGIDGQVGDDTIINNDTPCLPKTHYGKSKYEAEIALRKLESENYVVSIIRPPMVYGPNCPGNYTRLRNLLRIIPIFPKIDNRRSMIYINNLSEFIRLILDEQISGIFHPQNKEYVHTIKMAELIRKYNSKKIWFLYVPAYLIRKLGKDNKALVKLFGNLTIDKSLSDIRNLNYCIIGFEESIKRTESK
jgi:UDP-glucose 4-epimerase